MATSEITVDVHADREKRETGLLSDGEDGEGTLPDEETNRKESAIKAQRKIIRGRITRAINRMRESMSLNEMTKRRSVRELGDIRRDYDLIMNIHGELYEIGNPNVKVLDKWEDKLKSDVYDIEDRVEDYLNTQTSRKSVVRSSIEDITEPDRSETGADRLETVATTPETTAARSERRMANKSVDSWIDDLVEFEETTLPDVEKVFSLEQALYRLEASREVPVIEIRKFSGDPLQYVEFIESFHVHIHKKLNLSDDLRMAQLKMHLIGEAERSIFGFGSSGIMYATALKTIKQDFGHPSLVARSFSMKITRGEPIRPNDRQALRSFSADVINCISTLTRINHVADINSTESLRMVIQRLPDYMISSWKGAASAIRDRGRDPTLQDISEFINRTVRSEFDPAFGDLGGTKMKIRDQRSNPGWNQDKRKGINAAQEQRKQNLRCYMCGDSHPIYECLKFRNLSHTDKIDFIRNNRLCFSCLIKGHKTTDCRLKKMCNKDGCVRVHHPLLHTNPPSASGARSALDGDSILPVVRVNFRSSNGRIREGNVLIDGGAGTTIIRKDFAKSLGLQGKKEALTISVVGGTKHQKSDSRRLKFWISPIDGAEEFLVEAHDLDETVLSVPELNRTWLSSFSHIKDIPLSHKAGPIDLILGVQHSHLHAEQEVREGLPYEPVAKLTRLGWVVIGSEYSQSDCPAMSTIAFCKKVDKIDIEKMYDMENIGVRAVHCNCPKISMEDHKVLEMFEESCKRENDRYTIGLPWKRDPKELPDNYILAEKRLASLEKSLLKNPEKAEMYKKVMTEYESNGWSEKIDNDVEADAIYYLPHHGVVRMDKVSTPLRVVFDPACTYQGLSLNSFLHKGPSTLGDLFGILLRFREERVAFVGDISKMFLQICLPEEDTQVHRYLWRNMDASKKPSVYRLKRVTFGDKSSPEMANFVMRKIAQSCEENFPEAAEILKKDRYMDDLIHSSKTQSNADMLMKDLDAVLKTGSFRVKEWISNIQNGNKETEDKVASRVDLLPREEVKTLGVSWNFETDEIHFHVKQCVEQMYTKRSVLSKLSMFYDPLGLAAVVTIRAKIAMQNIWKLKHLDWDDRLPDDQEVLWTEIFTDLENLNDVTFDRCLKPEDAEGQSELHVFADASLQAYGACAYLVWPTPDSYSARLVASKVRVAPLRQSTVPRLELMAALLASRLSNTIYQELRYKPEVFLWSDSQIVLKWLESDSTSKKTFVAVRISEIQSQCASSKWNYVPSKVNPADDLSRGLKVQEMNGRWFNGPAFLTERKEWPDQGPREEKMEVEEKEEKKVHKTCASIQDQDVKMEQVIDCETYSTWRKLVRVTAYCFKFINSLRGKRAESLSLQREELEEAKFYWLHRAQATNPGWIERCGDLAPFERDGIVRVGGRLRHSHLVYEQSHPVLLPAYSRISKLIMQDAHEKIFHAGAERTLAECRREFWVIRGRNLAKKIVKECVTCRKLRKPPHETLMADLPPERLKVFSPPFTTTGVDLFGPFQLKYGYKKKIKAWGALFTCATTRAIHLEIVENLSTQSFLHALRRFISHHGWPKCMISDNGTSFVGAQKEIRDMLVNGRREIEDFSSVHELKWKFTTPLSPHQGGIYESLIKQVKRAIHVAIGQQTLSWNEMATVFAEIESLVNSRPLSLTPDNPNDLQPLTPNHFMLGRATNDLPQGPFHESTNLNKRFEYIQQLVQHFWNRFIREYLPTLMKRVKWMSKGRQFEIGDIVLIVDYNLPRAKWNLGRVVNTFPGKDGVVRNVQLRTQNGEYKRSVQKCCLILENVLF